MAEREISIVIRGKNLTAPEFDKARQALLGVENQSKKTSSATSQLAGAFKAMLPVLSVGAVVGAIKSYADLTGQLSDLSAKTGIGVEALQRLKYAAEQNGGSLDQVTNAITKLGANLAGGNTSAVGALDALGLSLEDIRQMEPDKAFTTIADAIAKVPDPMAQSRLAMDLFGKSGAELLPMMKGGLSETAAAADRLGIVLSEDVVKAGDDFGDTMVMLTSVGKGVIANALAPMIPVLTTVAQWVGERLPGAVRFVVDAIQTGLVRQLLAAKLMFNEFVLGLAEGINAIPLLGEKIGFSAATIEGLRGKVQHAKDTLAGFETQSTTVAAAQEKSARTVSTLNLHYAENAKQAKAAEAETKKLAAAQQKFLDSVKNDFFTSDYYVPFKKGVQESSFEVEELTANQDIATRAFVRFKEAVKGGLPDAVRSFDALGDSIRNMGNTILGALQGGGNVLQSVGASLGSALGRDVAENFGGAITGLLGKTLGGAVSAMLPGVGALLGPLLGKIGSLFTSKNTAEVRAYNVEIGKVRESLIAAFGPLDELERKANAVGLSFRENWGHQGKAGLEAMNNLAAEFRRRWDELNTSLATSQQELDGVLQRARDLGYEFDEAGNLVRVSFESMQEAAKRYGVDLGSLGPAFQGARLHEAAGQIINDFTLLTKGGADVGGVLYGMREEISALVRDSIKFGTDIPANMQPWIEELLESGHLTDENGEKLTDLTGIKFGEPVATEFEKITEQLGTLIDKIAEMVDRINSTISPAIDYATRDRTINLGWHVADFPDLDIPDVNVNVGGGERGYSSGTFGVHGQDFVDFGAGTRAVLHSREAVVPYEDRITTARRWIGQAAGVAAAATIAVAAPNVFIVNDLNGPRQVTEAEFRQVQARLNSGELTVPVRAITQRGS